MRGVFLIYRQQKPGKEYSSNSQHCDSVQTYGDPCDYATNTGCLGWLYCSPKGVRLTLQGTQRVDIPPTRRYSIADGNAPHFLY